MLVHILFPLVLGMLTCVAVAVVMIVVAGSRRRADTNLPRRGNCGYNLTGAPSNRCPECGKLLIEAGIITRPRRPTPFRQVIWGFVFVPVDFASLGVLGIFAMRWRARTARIQALTARQAAFQARMLAPVITQRATTTAPGRRIVSRKNH